MKKITKNGLAAMLCVLMIAFTSVGLAFAYFSDYTSTSGEAVLNLSSEASMDENVDNDGNKHIKVLNEGNTNLVVRVAVYGPWPTTDAQNADINAPGADWELIGEYYYYKKVLTPGSETSIIDVNLDNIPADSDLENIDIIVKFQSALVVYEDGAVARPDGWENFPNITE